MFLLDTNTYIEAKNRYYRMGICPGFWEWIDLRFSAKKISSIEMVYSELTKHSNDQDDLCTWVKERRAHFLSVDDNETQTVFANIAEFIIQKYREPHIGKFLDVADPWLIAKARTLGATVVTHESLVPPGSKKIKIPNICKEFGVEFCDTFDMLQQLEAEFVLKK